MLCLNQQVWDKKQHVFKKKKKVVIEKHSTIAGEEAWWSKPTLSEIQDIQGNEVCNYFCQSQALKNRNASISLKTDGVDSKFRW